jgi:hypothetical protein
LPRCRLPVGWTPEKTRSTNAIVSFPRVPVSRPLP